jgi:RNA polymerase sigma-70 factor (ECF subfamily)
MRGYALPAEADERRVTAATDPDAAFDALYRTYAPALRAYCRARLRNPADAEDACHEAILRAFNALPRFDTERPLWPWLATIAGNVCRDMQRRQVTAAAHVTYVDVAVDDLDELAAARTRRAILADALQSMPERYRSHVYLRDLEGWSYEAIASYDGSSVASVRSTLHRARSVLRERVRDTAERRREWPMPALVPLVFSRLRARIARARAAAPAAESVGRINAFDSLLTIVAHPAFAQGVLSLAAVVGVGLGVAADHYVDPGVRDLTISMQNAGSSSDLAAAAGALGRSGGFGNHWDDASEGAGISEPGQGLPDVSPTSDAGPTIATPTASTPSTPNAPAMPTVDASAPSAPLPPVHMTSGPEVNSPVDGTSENYEINPPTLAIDVPTAPQPTDPGDTKIELCSSPTSDDDGTVATLVCSGEPPPAPAPPDVSTEGTASALPGSELTLS